MADRDKKRPATPWVRTRTVHDVSPWVRLVEREVDFGSGRVERYHAIEQADYVCILAITPEGLIPVVRQYRPALERYTCELPAGMEDPGESAESTCHPRAPGRDGPSRLLKKSLRKADLRGIRRSNRSRKTNETESRPQN